MRTVKEKQITSDELVQALKSLGVIPDKAIVKFDLAQKDAGLGGIDFTFSGLTVRLVEENDSDELFKL